MITEFPDGIKIGGISLVPTQGTHGQDKRLRFQAEDGNSCELELVPGKGLANDTSKGVIAQVLIWGKETADGKHRHRLTMNVVQDGKGGEYCIIDSTTNDPSMSDGQSQAMPLFLNVAEGKGTYIGLYPDNTIDIQDRNAGTSTGRIAVSEHIKRIKAK